MRMLSTKPVSSAPEDLHGVTYTSPEKLKHYSTTVESYEPVAKVSEHCDVFRIVSKPALLGLIGAREFTDVICNYRCGGAYITLATEAPTEVLEAHPTPRGMIRGRDVNVLCACVPTAAPGESTVVMDIETDAGGSLRPWMVRKALPQTLLDSMKMTRQMAQQFPTWRAFMQQADVRFLPAQSGQD